MSDIFKKRILAFLFDFYCLGMAGVVIGCIIISKIELDVTFIGLFVSVWFILVLLLKDVFGQSLGKRIGKIKVITADGGKPPVYKLILRNVTSFIWPIELIAMLVSDSKTRLSDKLLGLRVEKLQ